MRPGEALDLPALAQALAPLMGRGARVRLLTARRLLAVLRRLPPWRSPTGRRATGCSLGGRPLAGLRWTRADLRHGIETELRGLSRRIRNRVLAGIATHRERDDPEQAVLDGINRFTVAGYHALSLLGEEPPREEVALISRLCARAGADAGPLLVQLRALRGGQRAEPAAVLAALLLVVAPVIDVVDTLVVSDA